MSLVTSSAWTITTSILSDATRPTSASWTTGAATRRNSRQPRKTGWTMYTTARHLVRRTRDGIWLLLVPAAALAAGTFWGVQAQGTDSVPWLGELRSAADVRVLPARTFEDLGSIARYSDEAVLVRIDSLTANKETELLTQSGLQVSIGSAEYSAKVLATTGSSREGSALRFAQDAWFRPGTDELASPSVLPTLEPGREYLVFLKDGRVVYPGGVYAHAKGRLWYIGHWSDSDSRTYPGPISGLTSESAISLIKESKK